MNINKWACGVVVEGDRSVTSGNELKIKSYDSKPTLKTDF
jgi:hypothetical protein